MNDNNDKKQEFIDILLHIEEPLEGLPRKEAFQKISLKQIAALGVGAKSSLSVIQGIVSEDGKSGIYYIDTKGKEMMHFKDSKDFIATLKDGNGAVGGGQAHIKKVPVDPTGIFMAAALTIIMGQLDDIRKTQNEMMDFLRAREKSKLQGNIDTLADVADNFRYNWDNETYKTNKHILVQDIRRDAEQDISLYRDQIDALIKAKRHVHIDRAIEEKMNKMQEAFREYQRSLYLFAFASFLEVSLLGNFDEQYLNNMSERISSLSYEFRVLYTDCYNLMEDISHKSVNTAAAKGIASASKGVGTAIAKAPIISKGPVDEALISAGEKLEEKNAAKIDEALAHLIEVSENCTLSFAQAIEKINRIYNGTKGVAVWDGSMHFYS